VPKAIIVTLMHGRYNLTNAFLSGLYRYEQENVEQVIIVDNYSTDDDSIAGLEDWRTNGKMNIFIYKNLVNVGFTLGANIGLKLATKQNENPVFLISNDVQISSKFIQQATDIILGNKCIVGNSLVSYDSGWNKFGDKVYEYLDGSFLATMPQSWRELGYFDTNYAPGDFEDVDLSTLAKTLGYKLIPLNNPSIHHLCAGTTGYSAEREVITRRNQEYFKEKWIK
jgi:GT2 family glycosyltransferase